MGSESARGLRISKWRQADATNLPFEDASFDAVVCQFGLMFFPDKAAGIREAFRVLKPGGRHILNVWESLEHNPVARITHETVTSFFPSDPPQFYTVPSSLHDKAKVYAWLEAAGFENIESHSVARVGMSPSAAEAAIGLVEGNPVYIAIMDRRPEALADITAAVITNLAAQLGDLPLRCPRARSSFRPGGPSRVSLGTSESARKRGFVTRC